MWWAKAFYQRRFVVVGSRWAWVSGWTAALVFLSVAGVLFRGAVLEGAATRRAAQGDGRPGVFVVETWRCSRTCSWYGSFVPQGDVAVVDREVELRGADEDGLEAGRRVRALDVGADGFVHAVGGSPEWGAMIAQSMGTVICGVIGIAALVSSCRVTVAYRRDPRRR
ncbi:hypothetical protein [Thermomonospora umbrina]|uniref:Uncharacterized protein n=1 Tax=Thermomonospora umbrina TaxID=111806 RepID=A0A3D9SJ79_9ACTN|nr:hypothetical protein [Thermomonospora umbrina]REE95949.1 hypothetical protein DFJ69_1364 [Thermomonospora umbrina]